MTNLEITYLITLAEEKTFQSAAKSLGISTSYIWKKIRSLEQNLGVQLVTPGRKQAHFTATGQLLLERAKILQIQFKDVEQEIKRHARGEIITIKIGLESFVLDDRYIYYLNRYYRKLPGITLRFYEKPTSEIVRSIESGELDIGFVRLSSDNPISSLMTQKLTFDEELWLAVNEKHPLAERHTIPIEKLIDVPLIMPTSAASPLRDLIIAAFAQIQEIPHILHETKTTDTAITLVAAGLGVAPVYKPTICYRYPKTAFRPFVRIPNNHSIFLVKRRDDDRMAIEQLYSYLSNSQHRRLYYYD